MRQVRCPYDHQGPPHSQGHNGLKTNILTKSSVLATHEGPRGCQPISCAAFLSSIMWNNPLYLVDRESHSSPMKYFPPSPSPSLLPFLPSVPLSKNYRMSSPTPLVKWKLFRGHRSKSLPSFSSGLSCVLSTGTNCNDHFPFSLSYICWCLEHFSL